MRKVMVAPAIVEEDVVAQEEKRLRGLQYMENVKRLGGKTWYEVCAEFETEMEAIKRAERDALNPPIRQQDRIGHVAFNRPSNRWGR